MQLSEEGRGPRGFTTGMSWVVSEDERAHAGWERHPRERAQHEPRGSGTAWHISLPASPRIGAPVGVRVPSRSPEGPSEHSFRLGGKALIGSRVPQTP